MPQFEILQLARAKDCVQDCNYEWLRCALQTLHRNNVVRIEFSTAVKDLLEKGRGKSRNILIVVPANCGKTFMLQPLCDIYWAFVNLATGSFAWV